MICLDRLRRFDVVARDRAIIATASLKGGLYEVEGKPAIDLVTEESDRRLRVCRLKGLDNTCGIILRPVVEYQDFVAAPDAAQAFMIVSIVPTTFASSFKQGTIKLTSTASPLLAEPGDRRFQEASSPSQVIFASPPVWSGQTRRARGRKFARLSCHVPSV